MKNMEIGKPEKEHQIEQAPVEEPLTVPDFTPTEAPLPEPASPVEDPVKTPA